MADDDQWLIAQSTADDQQPILFRIRETLPSFANKNDFKTLLAATWEYEADPEGGMPAKEEYDRMGVFEDLLMPAFEDAKVAFLTVVATGAGQREWLFYTSNPDEAMDVVNDALGEDEYGFPVEFSIDDDPDWVAYENFINNLPNDE